MEPDGTSEGKAQKGLERANPQKRHVKMEDGGGGGLDTLTRRRKYTWNVWGGGGTPPPGEIGQQTWGGVVSSNFQTSSKRNSRTPPSQKKMEWTNSKAHLTPPPPNIRGWGYLEYHLHGRTLHLRLSTEHWHAPFRTSGPRCGDGRPGGRPKSPDQAPQLGRPWGQVTGGSRKQRAVGQKSGNPRMACPGKWKHELKPALPWGFHFDPYPY